MRIRLPDPSALDALHDFLRRCEWLVDRDGDDLVAHGHPQVAAEDTAANLALFLGVWAAMHPAAPRPTLHLDPRAGPPTPS
jgi:hypothetical protein